MDPTRPKPSGETADDAARRKARAEKRAKFSRPQGVTEVDLSEYVRAAIAQEALAERKEEHTMHGERRALERERRRLGLPQRAEPPSLPPNSATGSARKWSSVVAGTDTTESKTASADPAAVASESVPRRQVRRRGAETEVLTVAELRLKAKETLAAAVAMQRRNREDKASHPAAGGTSLLEARTTQIKYKSQTKAERRALRLALRETVDPSLATPLRQRVRPLTSLKKTILRYRAVPEEERVAAPEEMDYVDHRQDPRLAAMCEHLLAEGLGMKAKLERHKRGGGLRSRVLLKGLREVEKGLRMGDVKLLIVARDIEPAGELPPEYKSEGSTSSSLLSRVNDMILEARRAGIPVAFPMSRYRIGRALGTRAHSIAAFVSFHGLGGAEKPLIELLKALKEGDPATEAALSDVTRRLDADAPPFEPPVDEFVDWIEAEIPPQP
jgi:hypothetical protein